MSSSRTTKVLGFSVPPALAREFERMARKEHRTKSELFREMWRVYCGQRTQQERNAPRWGDEEWIMNLMLDAKAEQARNPKSVAEELAEHAVLSAYGARQARLAGIKPRDINKVIHEYRKARRAAGRA